MFLMEIEMEGFQMDTTMLLDAVEPIAEAMQLCGADIDQQAQAAMMDREDYLSDLNFLNFLND